MSRNLRAVPYKRGKYIIIPGDRQTHRYVITQKRKFATEIGISRNEQMLMRGP